ncbi:cysteine-rich motor neuron 1 protein [Elysia marginata]|uniref:Cysteine-rich motor neuron 1 protein n=1 Tax=Elysia marginata TaxID=1093978 RepID=A0AAV4G6H4_9GAST|nr:cysteine-rich motor neuron 1 protein [Elysia marginata]
MVLPVVQAAMTPSDHPRKAGRLQYSSGNNISNINSGASTSHMFQTNNMYHQSRFAGNIPIHSLRDNCERLQLHRRHQDSKHEEGSDKDHPDRRGYFSDQTFKGLTFALLLVSLLLAGHLQGASALSCDICDRSKCTNITDCPGGMVLDVCHCCMLCARVANESCGGTFGILGKCDRNLHCFIRHPDSPNQEGICKVGLPRQNTRKRSNDEKFQLVTSLGDRYTLENCLALILLFSGHHAYELVRERNELDKLLMSPV